MDDLESKAHKELFDMPVSYGFDHVAIQQEKNKCVSRLDADIKSEFVRGLTLSVPVIASNMSSVVNAQFCNLLYKHGALGIMHRAFKNDADYIAEVKKIDGRIVAASVGVGEGQKELCYKLIDAGVNLITIDIAHGYADSVMDLGRWIKKEFQDTKVIVGNTVNTNMMEEVSDFADGVKVGIAQGSACLTKNTAGSTEKQFSAVYKFRYISKKLGLPIISDGGTKEYADIVKAIGAGANSVMAGSIFASCPESAAETISIDSHGTKKKVYFGMASEEAQNRWKGGLKPGTIFEGAVRHIDVGPPLEKLIEYISGALRSGITYSGTTNVEDFQKNVKFIRLA